MTQRRILLACLGSSGDLHPYIAVGLGLKDRGHLVTLGTSLSYRPRIEAAGLNFAPIRPDFYRTRAGSTLMEAMHEPRWGTVRVVTDFINPNLRATYEDLRTATASADVLITGRTIHPAALVAARAAVVWIPAAHSPALLVRPHAQAMSNVLTGLNRWRWSRAAVRPLVDQLGKPVARVMEGPLKRLHQEQGVPYAPEWFRSAGRPTGVVLGLFSPRFATPEPHWPAGTRMTGFPLYDGQTSREALQGRVAEFLDDGPPPVVFALGSTSVEQTFFRESLEAANRLGRRALFLIGHHARDVLPADLPSGMMADTYAAYSAVFPRSAAIVHHGGIGTTALALHSGRPMLVVPRSHDQPDNAARACGLGVARVLHRGRYTAARAVRELQRLLTDEAYDARAREIGRLMQDENGVQRACEAVEEVLGQAATDPL